MGYFFSLITLVVFFFTIALTNELWDQFHILRCNTGFACFIALLSMLVILNIFNKGPFINYVKPIKEGRAVQGAVSLMT